MTPYGQLLRFHSVAEFSSYCTSVLSLSYNASSTKYSTWGVSSHQYRYNRSNNESNVGLPPRSDFTAQPKLKGGNWKVTKPKQSPSFWIYTRAAHMDISDKKHYWNLKRGTISTSRFKPFPSDCFGALFKAGRGRGGKLESSSWGRELRGGVGRGEVERERRTKSTPPFTRLLYLFVMLWKRREWM